MAEKKTLGAYNIFDLREQALKRVPKGLFEFVDRGTEDEISLRRRPAQRADLKLLDTARVAAAEG